MRRIGNIELTSRPVYRAPMYTHREWCEWLWIRGSLDQSHRRCMHEDRCVARAYRSGTGAPWRYVRKDP